MINNNPENYPDSQAALNKIVFEYMREQKRKRIWRWVMRALILILIIWLLFQFSGYKDEDLTDKSKPHVGLIDISGTIFEDQPGGSDNFAKSIDKAYESTSMKALIIRIDSPGGSPVQADYIYNTIQYYRKKTPEVKIYAVCVDACASAAYYIAAAADEIYANPSSLVGSIGVLHNGFGFVDTMQKLGVTRRLATSGRNKGFLDQFSPEQPEQQQYLQAMLNIIHQQFIARVKEGRGKRLHIDDNTFSGLFWTGVQAKEMGLIDGFASAGQLGRETIKLDNFVDYTHRDTIFERVAKNIGTAMANQLPTALGLHSGFQ